MNALRPDLHAGDDRFILVAFAEFLQSAFLHFEFGVSRTGSNREVQDLIRRASPPTIARGVIDDIVSNAGLVRVR